jgi:hypothetical protein
MKTKSLVILAFSSLFAILLNSCSTSSTVVTGTWNKEDIEKDYNNILVAALTGNVNFKSVVEEELSESLKLEGVETVTSVEVLPPKFIDVEDEKQEILQKIKDDGIEGILTVSIIDKETETRYVPGAGSYAPYPLFNYYGSFWTYYNYWYPRFHSQDYYTTEKTYFIETNLYDAETEELVWSAQSKTYSPDYLESFSEDFAKEITAQLEEDEFIK